MTNSDDSDFAPSVIELVDDAIRTYTKRPEPGQSATQQAARFGFAFQEAERLAYCIRNRPIQLKDLLASPSSEDNPIHPLRAAPRTEVLAQVR